MLNILKLTCLKYWWNIKNNKFKLFSTIIMNTIILLAFFLGMKSEKTIELLGLDYATLFIIYIIIWIILNTFFSMSKLITNESKEGTLEILYTSPYGFIKILLSNIALNIIICIIVLILLCIVNNFITGVLNNVNFLELIFVITIGLLSLYGVGLVIAGVTLLAKEIDTILFIIKFVAAYCIMRFDNILIPFSTAKNMIAEIISNGCLDKENILSSIALLILNSLIYFVLGLVAYKIIEKKALKNSCI